MAGEPSGDQGGRGRVAQVPASGRRLRGDPPPGALAPVLEGRRLGGPRPAALVPLLQQREVVVVASEHQRGANGWIDVAVGEIRGAQRNLQRLDQQRGHRHGRPPGMRVDACQVGVGAEAAAGAVDRVELARKDRAGAGQPQGLGDAQYHAGAERLPARRCRRGALRGRACRARTSHDPPEVTGASVSAGAELDCCGTLDSGAAELASLPEELDSGVDEPDSLLEEPDSVAEEPDSPEELEPASEPLDPCSLVEGVDCSAEDPSVAEDDPSVVLDRGTCAGALSVEAPVEVPLPVRVPGAPAERWASLEAVARVALSVLPGKALAATAVSTPVSVALPAISQRLAWLSRRRAASREREVWVLPDIDCGAESRCTGGS